MNDPDMPFPHINDDDDEAMRAALEELVASSEATMALIVEKAGHLIAEAGEKAPFDPAVLATLASNASNAVQFMATNMEASSFHSMYQKGEQTNLLWMSVEEDVLLVVVFPAAVDAGAVKHYSVETAKKVAARIKQARNRELRVQIKPGAAEMAPVLDQFIKLGGVSAAVIFRERRRDVVWQGKLKGFESLAWLDMAANAWRQLQVQGAGGGAEYPSLAADLDPETRVLWMAIGMEDALLLGVYPTSVDPARVRYYAVEAAEAIATEMKVTRKRRRRRGGGEE